MYLRRKIDGFLSDWKSNQSRKPLIIKGARQVGKTRSVSNFGKRNYKSFVEINFVLSPKYRAIFDDGYSVDDILKNISLVNPSVDFIEGDTLLFFDEMQQCPACATSLKSFALDGRYDVICSGSLMGINYNEIESNSVGYKEDYTMHSLDFEEFLWANGISESQINRLQESMIALKPLSSLEMDVFSSHFRNYMVLGGMPAVVFAFLSTGQFSSPYHIQQQLLVDYEEDITKYAVGLDKGRVKNVYNNIAYFLSKENKKFQITKVAKNARTRDYVGVVDWLNDAGIINLCYCLNLPELPLKGNYNPAAFKVYFKDTGLLIASLDDEAQIDIRENKNFNTYKGAIYENIVADMLVKAGYSLYYYRNEKSTIEMDFFVRGVDSLIPLEVKAGDKSSPSLRRLVESDKYDEIKVGIKLGRNNIGFNGSFYTFPYFLTFLLPDFIRSTKL